MDLFKVIFSPEPRLYQKQMERVCPLGNDMDRKQAEGVRDYLSQKFTGNGGTYRVVPEDYKLKEV